LPPAAHACDRHRLLGRLRFLTWLPLLELVGPQDRWRTTLVRDRLDGIRFWLGFGLGREGGRRTRRRRVPSRRRRGRRRPRGRRGRREGGGRGGGRELVCI